MTHSDPGNRETPIYRLIVYLNAQADCPQRGIPDCMGPNEFGLTQWHLVALMQFYAKRPAACRAPRPYDSRATICYTAF